MILHHIVEVIQDSAIAGAMRGNSGWVWLFPIIETLHVLSFACVVGSIVMVDLRLVGLTSRDSAVSRLSREVLPYTWGAFAAAAITGLLLFSTKAETYIGNLQFELKFLFMALAGINMVVFHLGAYRRVLDWDRALPPPRAARVAGAISIALWCAVIFMGRWIGFTT